MQNAIIMEMMIPKLLSLSVSLARGQLMYLLVLPPHVFGRVLVLQCKIRRTGNRVTADLSSHNHARPFTWFYLIISWSHGDHH